MSTATDRITHHEGNGRTKLADLPPCDPTSEYSLLCAELRQPGAWLQAGVRADQFYTHQYRTIAAEIERCHSEGVPIDVAALEARLPEDAFDLDAEPRAWLRECYEYLPHLEHVAYHARKLHDAWNRREGMRRAGEFREALRDPTRTYEEALELLDLESLPSRNTQTGFIDAVELEEQFPHERPRVIDGLIRIGDTANIISVSKVGKSWLALMLSLCKVMGWSLFDRFECSPGRVLLIDNELHKETIAFRIKTVREAMGIKREDIKGNLATWPVRGKSVDILAIEQKLRLETTPGEFDLLVIDAKYRAMVADTSENDNGSETEFYNIVDRIARYTGAAIILIHHSSKGNQSDKRVTDVGAGAGAQSRAVDCHIILREHEEEGAAVLEAAVRSFAPVQPMVLRWEFPLWTPDDSLDPTALKRKKTAGEENQANLDREADTLILDALGRTPWRSAAQLSEVTGMGKSRVARAIARLLLACLIEGREDNHRSRKCTTYRKTINAK